MSVPLHRLPGGGVAGVLQGHGAALGKELEEEGEQVVRPRSHHDLLRGAAYPPVLGQQSRQGHPQRFVPLGVPRLEQAGVLVHRILVDAGPGGEGEHRGVHRRGGAVIPPLGGRLRRGGQVGDRLHRHVVELGGHIAAAGQALHVSLRQKEGVGPFHGAHAHPQHGAQPPLGGQLLSRPRAALLNFPGQVLVQLQIQGMTRGKDGHVNGIFHRHLQTDLIKKIKTGHFHDVRWEYNTTQ